MRKMVTTDVFEAMRLVQKSGLKEKLVPIIEDYAKSNSVERVGIVGLLSVIEVFAEASCEKLIYEFLSGPCEKTSKEIASMEIDDFAEMIETLGKENDLKRFFTALFGLISAKH